MSRTISYFFIFPDNICMETEEQITKYNLRIPTDLYQRIIEKSVEQRRSINNQIIVMLEDWFIDRGGPISNDELIRMLQERLNQKDIPYG